MTFFDSKQLSFSRLVNVEINISQYSYARFEEITEQSTLQNLRSGADELEREWGGARGEEGRERENTWMYFSSPCFLSRRAVGSRSLLVKGNLDTTLANPCLSGRSRPAESQEADLTTSHKGREMAVMHSYNTFVYVKLVEDTSKGHY